MAKVNYNNLSEDNFNNVNPNYSNDVGFFTLKNDNDEAVVRIMHDSVEDFDIQTVHNIEVGGKYRKVACIRDPREPLDNCPLCKNGTSISQRFFIRLIEYKKVTDNSGNVSIKAEPKVWERAVSYAKTIKSYLDNYGPVSDIICKIIRHGAAGDMHTTYEIVPNLSKQIYRDELYVKDPTLFANFDTFGTIVMDKNYSEIEHYLTTGSFPEVQKQNQTASTDTIQPNTTYSQQPASYAPPAGTSEVPVQPSYSSTPVMQPTPMSAEATAPRMGWENTQPNSGFDRPRRY